MEQFSISKKLRTVPTTTTTASVASTTHAISATTAMATTTCKKPTWALGSLLAYRKNFQVRGDFAR